MSFNICRGTFGSLAMFTAIRQSSSLIPRAQPTQRPVLEVTRGHSHYASLSRYDALS